MFDAKSLLDSLVTGAGQQARAPQASGGGSLGDLLGQVLGGQGLGGGRSGSPGGGAGSFDFSQLEGMVRNMMPKDGSAGAAPGESTGGGLSDILKKIQEQAGGAAGGAGAGSILDTLGKVLGQAVQGVEEGAAKIGATAGARDVIGTMTGKTPEELLAKLKDLAANNQLATGAALGGLGALVLGTQTGRSLAGGAVKLGAGALIGGLAYKAYQNYQAGKPLISGRDAGGVTAAPAGSGFEPAAQSNESSILFIRAMIAAAAGDGRIDNAEQAKIVGALKQAGLDAEAEEFLANELNNPASVEDLAAGVKTKQEAIEVYTAARMAIDPDSRGESEFLARLADVLGIDQKLAAHIEAATRGAAA